MTVRELIENLSQFDPDYEVLILQQDDECECEINGVGFYKSASDDVVTDSNSDEYDHDHVVIAID